MLKYLLYGSFVVQEKVVASILDSTCYLEKGKKEYTWRTYDACIGNAHISGGAHSFMPQLDVPGAALAGRYTVNNALGLWGAFENEYRAVSAGAYVGIFAGLSQWPVVPIPPAP